MFDSRRLSATFAALAMACAAAATALADSLQRFKDTMRDRPLAEPEPLGPVNRAVRLDQPRAPGKPFVAARAFARRLINRSRPQMTVGWRMCASV